MAVKPPGTALIRRPMGASPWRDADWEKLWLSIQGRPWSSLALVPGSATSVPDFCLTIAVTLARVGTLHLGTPIQVADASRIPLVHLVQFDEELRKIKEQGDLVIMALAPAKENPVTVSLAQAADAAVLCILLERMTYSEAKETVDLVGPGHFIGSGVFHEPPGHEA